MKAITPGKVFLVGAGPGDPELITVRGLRALQQADVVVYDRLANPALLAEIPPHAATIYVGKLPGRPSATQETIGQILLQEAQRGKMVVRLKGGDPFVFGRGGEEAQLLAAAGIPFEVVPGISSALAAPAYAGVPVTQRDMATAFTVITGHTAGADGGVGPGPNDDIDWERLPHNGTLVVLMGVGNLPQIAQRLLATGRASDTPVAIIENGTLPEQRVVSGTLADIAEVAKAAAVQSPAVIVIGAVAALHHTIAWFGSDHRLPATIAQPTFNTAAFG